MTNKPSALSGWTPEEIALAKRWVETWRLAGEDLERIRRADLRQLDAYHAISLLCGNVDDTVPPRAPRASSGLVEQQHWFMQAAKRE